MPYGNVETRADLDARSPEQYLANLIIQDLPEASLVLSAGPRRVTMSRKQTRFPVISLLPTAYFVSGDTGLKQTTEAAWTNKYLNAEELAVIVPIPEAVLEDEDFDLVADMRPLIVEAIGAAVDAAVLFGTNKPTSWDLGDGATANGIKQVAVAKSRAVTATGSAVADITKLFKLVAKDGHPVTSIMGDALLEYDLLGVTDSQGRPIFTPDYREGTPPAVMGKRFYFNNSGAWDRLQSSMIVGDMSRLIVGIRRDMQFEVFREGVITDNTNAIVLNLMQQDARAVRVTFRLGVTVGNPKKRRSAADANAYPFASLTPVTGGAPLDVTTAL
jgi:HK97 family phage major capsid protein